MNRVRFYYDDPYPHTKPDVPEGMALCTHCHAVKPLEEMTPNKVYKTGYAKYCLECDERYFQSAYKKRLKKGKKYQVALVVAEMRRKGEWNPKPCEVCGSIEKIEGHHEDYDKPREITWLCRNHHFQRHGLIKVKELI